VYNSILLHLPLQPPTFNHTQSKFWTACYTSHDGRKLKRSTKSTDKNQALEIAIDFERVEKQAKQGAISSA